MARRYRGPANDKNRRVQSGLAVPRIDTDTHTYTTYGRRGAETGTRTCTRAYTHIRRSTLVYRHTIP